MTTVATLDKNKTWLCDVLPPDSVDKSDAELFWWKMSPPIGVPAACVCSKKGVWAVCTCHWGLTNVRCRQETCLQEINTKVPRRKHNGHRASHHDHSTVVQGHHSTLVQLALHAWSKLCRAVHRAQAWHFHDKFSGGSEFTWRAGSRECARTDGRRSAISQDERFGGKRRVRPKHFRRQEHRERPVRVMQAVAGASGNHTPRLALPVVNLEAWLQLFAMAVSRQEAVLQNALLFVNQHTRITGVSLKTCQMVPR